MLVLGVNAYHADAAAVLYRDGKLVAAIEEERLNRVKHCAGFPELSIREVLRMAGADIRDVDEIAVARDSRANLRGKLAWVFKNLRHTSKVVRKRLTDRAKLTGLEQQVADACGVPLSAVGAKLRRVEHHFAHAVSAYLPSPFDNAAILTLDGFGDFCSALMAHGAGRDIRVLSRVTYPHSLGILYTAVCQFIGFDRYGDEGKVMGLASYGEPEYADAFRKLLRLTPQGFELDLQYFNHHTEGVLAGSDEHGTPHFAPLYTARMAALLGPPRSPDAPLTDRERNIAASLQQRLEEAFLHLAGILHDNLKRDGAETDALCLAGGVALNGVANGRLLRESPFKRIYIQPAAGDDGTALGAAAWASAQAGAERFEQRHAYWGPAFDDDAIERALEGTDLHVQQLGEPELLNHTAERIKAGGVVGWFQGAMEWGPRALGNRSILAHPGHPGMKDILNARIKHREPFRPFAPSIKAERVGEYFDCDHESPFMLLVYNTRADKREELCAVNHVDDTGRVQTVSKGQNPRYYDLLDAFERQTGTPALLNTSFNENEPIVCTPQQALDCFQRTHMDMLVMNDFVVTRGARTADLKEAHAVHNR
jgi:carbamoyltransferase